MKVCPHCQTRYTDDTLQFCLQDGAALTSSNDQTSMPTADSFEGEQETVVKNRPDQIEFDLQNSKETQYRQPQSANYQTETRKSNTGLIIATTVLATILIFGVGVAAWIYFGNKKEVTRDANVKNSFPDNSAKNKNGNTEVFPPENTNEKPSVRPTEQKTPAPDFDAEEVKANVSKTVYAWKSAAESISLSEYMTHYAARLDYYNKKNASIGTVRADKQKAFSTYDTIKINLSNMRVTPDETGENATAVFDKEWYFENAQKVSEGKVQTQLKLKKFGGDWKITSERDLKVYYVN